MLLRINSSYLDFNDEVDIERHVKIFEEIDATYGDFSYSFVMPNTANNLFLLGLPHPDVSGKSIYSDVLCDLEDETGNTLYKGSLKVERITKTEIQCSFFSGNFNWIAKLTGNVNDLDFSEYDTELTVTNIQNSWTNSSGATFPLIDTGALITRSYRTIAPQDFSGCMYVKTIFQKMFYKHGIKIEGELINDFIFNNLTVCKNTKSKADIDASTCYIQKTATTTRAVENTSYKISFQNDSTYPYFDGTDNGFDLANSRYIAPYKMRVLVECILQADIQNATYSNRIEVWINGAFTFVDIGLSVGGLYNSATPGDQDDIIYKQVITLEAGDILEIYSNWQQSGGSTQNDIVSGTLRITPQFIYNVKGVSMVPTWTAQSFVVQILNLFNVVTDYNAYTKTVTFNLFDKIKSKTPIDISEHIEIQEEDYSEFISNYGKRNIFQYEEGDTEEIRDYNVTKFIKYGAGTIQIENDFISNTAEVVNSEFKAPISYLNGVFGCSMERVKFIDLNESDETQFTSVTDSSGIARFNVANNPYLIGDIVRISDCNLTEYNGDRRVSARANTYFELQGINFTESGTGKAVKINHNYTNSNDVYLFVNIPNYSVGSFSELSSFNFPSAINTVSNIALAYFNVLENGQPINSVYKQGLSFGSVESDFSYQKTLLETYWRNFGSILSDPVKLKCIAHFPKSVYASLTPLTPVYIKSQETTNLYYINKIRGYRGSHLPCEVELIKL